MIPAAGMGVFSHGDDGVSQNDGTGLWNAVMGITCFCSKESGKVSAGGATPEGVVFHIQMPVPGIFVDFPKCPCQIFRRNRPGAILTVAVVQHKSMIAHFVELFCIGIPFRVAVDPVIASAGADDSHRMLFSVFQKITKQTNLLEI